LQQQQSQLLAQIKQQLANLPPLAPQPTEPSPAQLAQEQQRQQLLKLLAQIERRIHTENARPRKRYVSPATQEAVYALYYDQLRIKIETKGTHNFPVANGQKLYGALTMLITINSDGRVLQTEVIAPSGNPTLDRRAQAIVQSAAPFGAFNAAMRNQADQLLVVSTFTFNRDETLQTQFVGK
jgi:protein TonB